MRQAVILAGGKGTRLRTRLHGLPKPLVDICGKPLLERQILLCKRFGISRILVLVNHAAERIVEFCRTHRNWDIDIDCIDDVEPRGTAGAVLAVFDRLEDEFLVVYGDTMLDIDLGRFVAAHRSQQKAVTLFLHPNDHPADSDLVDMDQAGRVVGFHPYPHGEDEYLPNLVNAALYVMKREALAPWRSRPEIADFGRDLFPEMLRAGVEIAGYRSPEYIKDCGTPERLDRVCADYASGVIGRASLTNPQMAVFLDRDGTINRDAGYVVRPEDFDLIRGVESAIRRLNKAEYRTVVVTNQPVIARGDCSPADLRRIHSKMETLLGRGGAYLDRIYWCPHHPQRGFPGEVAEFKVACDCRKPAIGMLEQARRELNIDFARSWLVGDSTADILAANRAGIASILVQTGVAGLDQKYPATADFVLPDLGAAVDFILGEYPRLVELCRDYARRFAAGDIILIGGLSRSGKSTLATVMRRMLLQEGRTCHQLSADRWIFSQRDRGEGVLGRYDVAQLRQMAQRLAGRQAPMEIELPRYDRLRRLRVDAAERVRIEPGDIVIIEGTVALQLADDLKAASVHRIHVETDEDRRRARLIRYYVTAGYSREAAEGIYDARQRDETPIVAALAKRADYAVVLPVAGGAGEREFS